MKIGVGQVHFRWLLASTSVAVLILASPGIASATTAVTSGSPDPSFGSGGTVTEGSSNSLGNDIYRQANGQIVLAAEVDGQATLVRMAGNGKPDPTFGTDGVDTMPLDMLAPGILGVAQGVVGATAGFSGFTTVSEASDGTYYAGGYGGPNFDGFVMHLLSNGAVDPTFGQGGVVTLAPTQAGGGPSSEFPCPSIPYQVGALQNDQGVVVSVPNCEDGSPQLHEFNRLGAENTAFEARANALINPDWSGGASLILGAPPGFVVFANGDILVPVCPGQSPQQAGVMALHESGSLDTSWGVNGCSPVLTPPVNLASSDRLYGAHLAVGPQNTVVFVTNSYSGPSWMSRLNSDGSVDPTFGSGTAVMTPTPLNGTQWNMVVGLSVADTGDFVILSSAGSGNGGGEAQGAEVASVLANGTTDPAFGTNGVVSLPSFWTGAVEVQPGYRAVVAGTTGQGCEFGPGVPDSVNQLLTGNLNPSTPCVATLTALVDKNP